MSKSLRTFVTVHDDEGTAHTFSPDDNLPKWAREKITNPNVWADTQDDNQPSDDGSLTIPPLGGAGSSAEAWRAYATAAAEAAGMHIEIPEEAKRDDIVDALKAAGIPTE